MIVQNLLGDCLCLAGQICEYCKRIPNNCTYIERLGLESLSNITLKAHADSEAIAERAVVGPVM